MRFWPILLLCATAFAAVDQYGNSNDPVVEPCTFEEAAKTCSKEFTLPGFQREAGNMASWAYNIVLTPPDKYLGWLEWHVYVFNGKKWLDQGTMVHMPGEHEQTIVTSASQLKIRVTVKIVLGKVPGEDEPMVITATPAKRADFVPIE